MTDEQLLAALKAMKDDLLEHIHDVGAQLHTQIKIHRTLRTSPAMAAGVTNRLWEVSDLVALWEAEERRLERAA